jgi:hypothetical protein
MVGKDKPKLHTPHRMMLITFIMTGIIATGTLYAFPLILNQNHTAMALQQQLKSVKSSSDKYIFVYVVVQHLFFPIGTK